MTGARRKLGTSIATAVLLGTIVGVPVLSAPAGAAPATVTIGVDHATPASHNFEYVDFFPRSGATIHSGDIVHFQWSSTPDGLHTATLLRAGETPAMAWNTVYPITTPDADDSASQQQFNPQIGGPTFPPPGSGAPGAWRRDDAVPLRRHRRPQLGRQGDRRH